MKRIVYAGALLLCSSGPAMGQMIYDARFSFLEIQGIMFQGDDFYRYSDAEDPDFAPFDDSLFGESGDGLRTITGRAKQYAELNPREIFVTGEAYSRAFDDYGQGQAWASAESYFDAFFDLQYATPVTLSGDIEMIRSNDTPEALMCRVTLLHDGMAILTIDREGPIDFTGMFDAGSYGLRVEAYTACNLGSGGGDAYISARTNFQVVFELPDPGDFDGDGDVDGEDFAALAECLGGPDVTPAPQAPLTAPDCLRAFDDDGDGDVDLANFATFQDAFTGAL